jgi:hypothetical protein
MVIIACVVPRGLENSSRFHDQVRNFAVNSRDFNAAAMTFVLTPNLRRNSAKSISHCRIVSSSRHSRTF